MSRDKEIGGWIGQPPEFKGDLKMKITVLLKNGTVGVVAGGQSVTEGDVVIVTLSDENGMPLKVRGMVEEILMED